MSFNDEQITLLSKILQFSYMKYLATVPPEQKCYCGWYMANECPNCKGRATLADRIKVQCPCSKCRNYPHLDGKPTITHNIACTMPDWQPAFSSTESASSPPPQERSAEIPFQEHDATHVHEEQQP